MPFTVELGDDGGFSLSTSSPGPQTDAAYDRQLKVNDRLGGRVFMAYATDADRWASLLGDIRDEGFDVPIVVMADEQLTRLRDEIEHDRLWTPAGSSKDGLLMASPLGFCVIGSAEEFRALLPSVEPLDVISGSPPRAAPQP
jgi:hypothetical protein